jgi:16S rRNA (guanine966-N2)-methyltransferase
VREALFSVLEADLGSLHGLRFLDLYAGSGAVGLEAASRGAVGVTAVEADHRTARLVAANASALGLDVDVRARSVSATLAAPPGSAYDVVFLDPPYPVPSEQVSEVLARLVANGWVSSDGVVVVERSARSVAPAWPDGLGLRRQKRYGETVLWYLRRDSDMDPDASGDGGSPA